MKHKGSFGILLGTTQPEFHRRSQGGAVGARAPPVRYVKFWSLIINL